MSLKEVDKKLVKRRQVYRPVLDNPFTNERALWPRVKDPQFIWELLNTTVLSKIKGLASVPLNEWPWDLITDYNEIVQLLETGEEDVVLYVCNRDSDVSSVLLHNILESTSEQGKIQKLMFTATMSGSIERIANGYLQKPSYATIGRGEGSIPQIQQLVYYSGSEEQRFRRVKSLLEQYMPPIIVFVTYKKTADWLVQKFNQETSFRVTVLHGSKSQDQREHSLQLLRSGKAQVMIATNVAARGLDIPNVSLVVNFQISKQFEDYIHRIGRTGRAGMKGTAITFLGDDENTQIVEEISKYIKNNNPTNSNVFDNTLREKYNIENHQMDELIY